MMDHLPGDSVFGLGGISLSPILNASITFQILDSYHENSSIPKDHSLSSLDWKNLLGLLTVSRGLPKWGDIEDLYKKNPAAFQDRFYNEFTHIDLRGTVEAVGLNLKDIESELSYESVFVNQGFGVDNDYPLGSDLSELFKKQTDLYEDLMRIRRPHLIYFSQDDPVLSAGPGLPQPNEISSLLDALANNPSIIVFNPPFGAHVGALVDPIFEEMVTTFFRD